MTLLLLAKVTLVFAAALLASMLAKRAAAATRHAILAGAQLAALALPLLDPAMPPLRVIPTSTPAPKAAALDITMPLAEHSPTPIPHPSTPSNTNTLAIIWLAGVTLIVLVKLTAYARAFAVARRARGMFSDEVNQPAAFGRRVLLPASAKTWSGERLRIVLLHEEAHVARHDTLLAVIGDAACALYWFHPLAWILARRAGLERERACDDRVLNAGVAAGDYAEVMLDVARTLTRRQAAAMPMAEASHIERRIRAILDPNTSRRPVHAMAGLASILAAAPLLAALHGAIPRPRAIEPDLLGNWEASPFSERVEPAAPLREVDANGPDAVFIAEMRDAAEHAPRTPIDFVAERARWALTRVRGGELVTPLIESLRDGDWRIRAYAAWALGYSGDARATAPLTVLLEEPIWRVRAMAANALANLADPAAEDAMLARIGDDAWQVRFEVVRYLAAIGGHDAEVEALRSDRHMAVRGAAER
jgi:beta-lactamase regulating signal transducer with metallopeptidase domain